MVNLTPPRAIDEVLLTDCTTQEESIIKEEIKSDKPAMQIATSKSPSEEKTPTNRRSTNPKQRAQAITAREIQNIKTNEERHLAWKNDQNQTTLARLQKEQTGISHEIAVKQEALERIVSQISQFAENDAEEEKEPEIEPAWLKHMLWMISGLANGILRIIFCYVFATLIHESAGDLLKDSVHIGVGVQLVSAFITCTTTAIWSSVGASIGGPDIIQALLLASMGHIISDKTNDKGEALSTMLFLTAFTTLLIAITWILISSFGLLAVYDYFPISAVTGFLGCVGYMALAEAVSISVGGQLHNAGNLIFWKLLLPAIPIGLALFYFQKYRIGSPLMIYSLILLIPVIIFFLILYAGGEDLHHARAEGWLFKELRWGLFWEQWEYMNFRKVHFTVVARCIPDMMLMLSIVTVDAFLKLFATKAQLHCEMDMNMEKEFKLAGYQNLVSAIFVGAAGYSQVKYNVLNFSITKEHDERRAGMLVGLVCGIMWFGGLPVINFLPRFVFGGFVIFAGMPFIDRAVVAYRQVTKKEFIAIWSVISVYAVARMYLTSGLLIAVIFGIFLATLIFMLQYTRISVIRDIISGKNYQSAVGRTFAEQSLVERLSIRYLIVELKGFIFFGTASQVLNWCKEETRRNSSLQSPVRLRYIAMDFSHVQQIDYSGAKIFREVVEVIRSSSISLLFTGLNEKMCRKFKKEGVLSMKGVMKFDDLNYASEYVEDSLLYRASFIRTHWLVCDSFKKLHSRALLKTTYEIFEAVLGSQLGGRLWRYAKKRWYKAGEFLCHEGRINNTLYLVQRGTVTSFVKVSDGTMKRVRSFRRGSFINESSLFLDHPVNYSCCAVEDTEVWAIDRKSMKELEAYDPFLGLVILRNILRISSVEKAHFNREVESNYYGRNPLGTLGSSVKTFGQSVLEQITVSNDSVSNVSLSTGTKDMGTIWNPSRHHSFEHILISSPKRKNKQTSSENNNPRVGRDLVNTRPHLSVVLQRDAIDCFLHHAMDCKGSKGHNQKKRRFRRSFQAANSFSNNMPKVESQRRLNLEELQHAVMDLGFFPTEDEVKLMHKTLGSEVEDRFGGDEYFDGADIKEFLQMIEVLSLAPLSERQVFSLKNIYEKHCDEEGHLWREDLSSLMNALGHPEDELELEMLMYEWDVNQNGYLDFDAFISIVAHVMKAEELDQQVENDFLTICGEDFEEIQQNKENLRKSVNFSITPKDIMRFCHSNDILLEAHIAEEMVFDACESGNGAVGLSEFITTIETVFRNESALPDLKKLETEMFEAYRDRKVRVADVTLNFPKSSPPSSEESIEI